MDTSLRQSPRFYVQRTADNSTMVHLELPRVLKGDFTDDVRVTLVTARAFRRYPRTRAADGELE